MLIDGKEWRLVPTSPTPEWVAAIERQDGVRVGTIGHIIEDVLAAAPTPPAATAAPSDEEIEALAKEHLWAHAQNVGAGYVCVEGEVAFARALLSRYGQAPAASAEQLAEVVVAAQAPKDDFSGVRPPMRHIAGVNVGVLERAARAQAPAADGDALDAARYRWVRDQTETDGIAIVMKNKHFDESRSCAENIDKFIDAALAAQRKGDA